MKLGMVVRNMGPQSTAQTMRGCARAAEDTGLDEIWVVDHVAIPPDDAEGSGGRYLDPLVALGWLAGATERIGIGTAILNLPYRPPLPTAKQVATLQELSGGRLRLGIGVGWMAPEFQALGVDRTKRGKITDETLEILHRCFAQDEVELNGQRFLFKPRPERPPIFIGGGPPHAFERAVRHGDGWMPMGGDPESLAPKIAELQKRAAEHGRDPLEVAVLGGIPLGDPARARDALGAYAEVGVTRFAQGGRYEDVEAFRALAEGLVAAR
jgi:probable F420-dependent oxidoreductase